MRVCVICDCEFDPLSALKAAVGGKIDTCGHCSKETAVPYLGLTSGDGKASGVTILAFESVKDRNAYASAWRSNAGSDKGACCQLSASSTPMSGMKFRKVHESGLGMNHKGKL